MSVLPAGDSQPRLLCVCSLAEDSTQRSADARVVLGGDSEVPAALEAAWHAATEFVVQPVARGVTNAAELHVSNLLGTLGH